MAKYDWAKMYKAEEYIEREAYSCVESAIIDFYNISEISDLTQEQWDDIHAWQEENVSEYSPMNMGFSDVYNVWEMENE